MSGRDYDLPNIELQSPVEVDQFEKYLDGQWKDHVEYRWKAPEFDERFNSVVLDGYGSTIREATVDTLVENDYGGFKTLLSYHISSSNSEEHTKIILEPETFSPEKLSDIESDLRASLDPKSQSDEYSWDDFGGYEEKKSEVRDKIELPLKNPDLYDQLGLDGEGIILHGPPGTGKTQMMRIISDETDAELYKVKPNDIYSKLVGETEQNVTDLFNKARETEPSLILLDEIDAYLSDRGNVNGTESSKRAVNTMLTELDGLNDLGNVMVVGTTNRLEDVDDAFRRSGRLSNEIFIGYPDKKSREEIWDIHTRKPGESSGVPVVDDINYSLLADMSEGLTGSGIEGAVQQAGHQRLREFRNTTENNISEITLEENEDELRITMEDIENVLDEIDIEENEDREEFSDDSMYM